MQARTNTEWTKTPLICVFFNFWLILSSLCSRNYVYIIKSQCLHGRQSLLWLQPNSQCPLCNRISECIHFFIHEMDKFFVFSFYYTSESRHSFHSLQHWTWFHREHATHNTTFVIHKSTYLVHALELFILSQPSRGEKRRKKKTNVIITAIQLVLLQILFIVFLRFCSPKFSSSLACGVWFDHKWLSDFPIRVTEFLAIFDADYILFISKFTLLFLLLSYLFIVFLLYSPQRLILRQANSIHSHLEFGTYSDKCVGTVKTQWTVKFCSMSFQSQTQRIICLLVSAMQVQYSVLSFARQAVRRINCMAWHPLTLSCTGWSRLNKQLKQRRSPHRQIVTLCFARYFSLGIENFPM